MLLREEVIIRVVHLKRMFNSINLGALPTAIHHFKIANSLNIETNMNMVLYIFTLIKPIYTI